MHGLLAARPTGAVHMRPSTWVSILHPSLVLPTVYCLPGTAHLVLPVENHDGHGCRRQEEAIEPTVEELEIELAAQRSIHVMPAYEHAKETEPDMKQRNKNPAHRTQPIKPSPLDM